MAGTGSHRRSDGVVPPPPLRPHPCPFVVVLLGFLVLSSVSGTPAEEKGAPGGRRARRGTNQSPASPIQIDPNLEKGSPRLGMLLPRSRRNRKQRIGNQKTILELKKIHDANPRNMTICSELLKEYCRAWRFEEALKVTHAMSTKGIVPSQDCFSTLLEGLSVLGSWTVIKRVLDDMDTNMIPHNIQTINALIQCALASKDKVTAREIFLEIDEGRKIRPNRRTFDMFFRYHVEHGELRNVVLLAAKMKRAYGFTIDNRCIEHMMKYPIPKKVKRDSFLSQLLYDLWGRELLDDDAMERYAYLRGLSGEDMSKLTQEDEDWLFKHFKTVKNWEHNVHYSCLCKQSKLNALNDS